MASRHFTNLFHLNETSLAITLCVPRGSPRNPVEPPREVAHRTAPPAALGAGLALLWRSLRSKLASDGIKRPPDAHVAIFFEGIPGFGTLVLATCPRAE